MYRYIIEDSHPVPPFNQPASLLTIGLSPLKIQHEELFASYFGMGVELKGVFSRSDELPHVQGEALEIGRAHV